jgi:hypothetical protein
VVGAGVRACGNGVDVRRYPTNFQSKPAIKANAAKYARPTKNNESNVHKISLVLISPQK